MNAVAHDNRAHNCHALGIRIWTEICTETWYSIHHGNTQTPCDPAACPNFVAVLTQCYVASNGDRIPVQVCNSLPVVDGPRHGAAELMQPIGAETDQTVATSCRHL